MIKVTNKIREYDNGYVSAVNTIVRNDSLRREDTWHLKLGLCMVRIILHPSVPFPIHFNP